jgi:hypothetical protein
MADLTTLQARLEAIDAALASGMLSYSVDGQSASFVSASDMRRARREIVAQIDRCIGRPSSRPVASSIFLGGGP